MSDSASGLCLSEDNLLKYLLATYEGMKTNDLPFEQCWLNITADPKDVKDELMNFLLAIRDTTASFLTFTTYVLASSPEITADLQDEIASVMDEREMITSADIGRMPYLRSVLNEVLRLFPPVPFNIRRCLRDSILPSPLSKTGPFPIKKGTSVTYIPFIIQRQPDLWGSSAESFDPDRWSTDFPKASFLHSFAFHPFNGGPRLCLGQQYAYIECSHVIIRLYGMIDKLCEGGLWIRGEPKNTNMLV
ncbi:hypothetical protein Clacol_006686 [Clathrus columnatus]|uniref:Cytochrome P450 n=1 Tax=Clathrus columnatus TaxID=1419009 RepID=A0AAV5AIE0_9AGAM|nr:hypothetical protein Clacol_006686 [Clathrus columnatus]